MWRAIVILIIIIAVVVGIAIFSGNKEAPGDNNKPINQATTMNKLKLTSSEFKSGGSIPSKYTCDGENINPPFQIFGVPERTKSLALIMDDPDAKPVAGKVWDHWLVWNIPASTTEIIEGREPEGIHGKGTSGNTDYYGPCPPDKEHTYYFKLYALDAELELEAGSNKQELENAMDGHILSQTVLLVNYEKQ